MQHNLKQTQTQRLLLLPQMKLNLKILQLPLVELKQKIEEELVKNPALEEEPSSSTSDDADSQVETWEMEDDDGYRDDSETNLVETHELTRRKNYQESILTENITLADHIHSELYLLNLSDDERIWAEELIGSLDDNGFLAAPISELARKLSITDDSVEELLKKLQAIDPPGIFARNLAESLTIQLNQKDHPDISIARDIVQHNFDLIQKKSFDQLSRIYKIPEDRIRDIFALIQHLDPKPGKAFIESKSLEIVPDIVISAPSSNETNSTATYRPEIQELGIPQLSLSNDYKSMLNEKSLDPQAKKYLKENVEQAIWLIEALKYRSGTLASIVKEVLKRQPGFLEKGFSVLKPLTMKEISETLKIHESTVSRAVSGKYIQTPIGTFPVRAFFSGKIQSTIDGDESQKSVMEKIKKVIETENPKKPLSDQKITELLSKENIQIARRTVAKYREMLKILPTSLRREK